MTSGAVIVSDGRLRRLVADQPVAIGEVDQLPAPTLDPRSDHVVVHRPRGRGRRADSRRIRIACHHNSAAAWARARRARGAPSRGRRGRRASSRADDRPRSGAVAAMAAGRVLVAIEVGKPSRGRSWRASAPRRLSASVRGRPHHAVPWRVGASGGTCAQANWLHAGGPEVAPAPGRARRAERGRARRRRASTPPMLTARRWQGSDGTDPCVGSSSSLCGAARAL